jgi:hypothetical protein
MGHVLPSYSVLWEALTVQRLRLSLLVPRTVLIAVLSRLHALLSWGGSVFRLLQPTVRLYPRLRPRTLRIRMALRVRIALIVWWLASYLESVLVSIAAGLHQWARSGRSTADRRLQFQS